jgi:hypothetical protein
LFNPALDPTALPLVHAEFKFFTKQPPSLRKWVLKKRPLNRPSFSHSPLSRPTDSIPDLWQPRLFHMVASLLAWPFNPLGDRQQSPIIGGRLLLYGRSFKVCTNCPELRLSGLLQGPMLEVEIDRWCWDLESAENIGMRACHLPSNKRQRRHWRSSAHPSAAAISPQEPWLVLQCPAS